MKSRDERRKTANIPFPDSTMFLRPGCMMALGHHETPCILFLFFSSSHLFIYLFLTFYFILAYSRLTMLIVSDAQQSHSYTYTCPQCILIIHSCFALKLCWSSVTCNQRVINNKGKQRVTHFLSYQLCLGEILGRVRGGPLSLGIWLHVGWPRG